MVDKKEQKLIPQEDIESVYETCRAFDLSVSGQAQRRGYLLQDLIYSVLTHEGLNPRTSYKPKGEEIDGSFYMSHKTCLLEAKWTKKPTNASSLYSFRGKVEGKLSGTMGVFISMSGFSIDAPDALTMGKPANSVLFDESDMDAIFKGEVTFTQVLDFKIRQAGETGKPYVPFALPKTVQTADTKQVVIHPTATIGIITSQGEVDVRYGMSNVLLVCEGPTDSIILESLFKKLLIQRYLHEDIALEIIVMGYITNWAKRLPEIVNIKLKSIGQRFGGLIVLMDSDVMLEPKLSTIKNEIFDNMRRTAISLPMHVVFARPNIENWLDIETSVMNSELPKNILIEKALENVDLQYLVDNNPEFAGMIGFLNSLVDEDRPLWESDAISAVNVILENAEWNDENKTVSLHTDYDGRGFATVCHSLEELIFELVEIASVGSMNSMPFEGGAAVFEIDYDSIVQEILIDDYADEIKDMGWEL